MTRHLVQIRPLSRIDAVAFHELRLKGLQLFPDAFGESAEDFESLTPEQIEQRIVDNERTGGTIFGAFDREGLLKGITAVARTEAPKMRHRGHVWGVIVDPEASGKGIGRQLMQELLAWADLQRDLTQLDLAVTVHNIPAIKLYESLGFRICGTDPERMRIGDHYVDEYFMVLDLK